MFSNQFQKFSSTNNLWSLLSIQLQPIIGQVYHNFYHKTFKTVIPAFEFCSLIGLKQFKCVQVKSMCGCGNGSHKDKNKVRMKIRVLLLFKIVCMLIKN